MPSSTKVTLTSVRAERPSRRAAALKPRIMSSSYALTSSASSSLFIRTSILRLLSFQFFFGNLFRIFHTGMEHAQNDLGKGVSYPVHILECQFTFIQLAGVEAILDNLADQPLNLTWIRFGDRPDRSFGCIC